MASTRNKYVRAHLRLAYTPPREASAPSRAWLFARAMLVRLRIVLLNVVAVAGAVAALVPLLVRGGPTHRRRQLPRRVARVIPLETRRRASPD